MSNWNIKFENNNLTLENIKNIINTRLKYHPDLQRKF